MFCRNVLISAWFSIASKVRYEGSTYKGFVVWTTLVAIIETGYATAKIFISALYPAVWRRPKISRDYIFNSSCHHTAAHSLNALQLSPCQPSTISSPHPRPRSSSPPPQATFSLSFSQSKHLLPRAPSYNTASTATTIIRSSTGLFLASSSRVATPRAQVRAARASTIRAHSRMKFIRASNGIGGDC